MDGPEFVKRSGRKVSQHATEVEQFACGGRYLQYLTGMIRLENITLVVVRVGQVEEVVMQRSVEIPDELRRRVFIIIYTAMIVRNAFIREVNREARHTRLF